MIDWTSRSPSRNVSEDEDDLWYKFDNSKMFIHPVHIVYLECHECDQKLSSERQLLEHLKEKHKIYEYQCNASPSCVYSSVKVNKLQKHHKAAHPGKIMWPCPLCDEEFTRWTDLGNHHYNYHAKGHFECSEKGCTFSGARRQIVLNHFRKVHESEEN